MMPHRSNRLRTKTLVYGILLFLMACFPLAELSAQVLPADEPGSATVGGRHAVGHDVFQNKEAADLVRRARRNYDLRTGKEPHTPESRDKAIELYQLAIEAQPDAATNATLALRIAQHYSLFGIRNTGLEPDYPKALEWSQRAVSLAKPIHQLWGTAHISLGNTLVRLDKGDEAIAAFKRILEMDPEKMELPPWERPGDTGTKQGRAEHQRELKHIRTDVRKMRKRAVDRVYYVATHQWSDKSVAKAQMQQIMQEYQGTPIAERASKLLDRARRILLPFHEEMKDVFDNALDDFGSSPQTFARQPKVPEHAPIFAKERPVEVAASTTLSKNTQSIESLKHNTTPSVAKAVWIVPTIVCLVLVVAAGLFIIRRDRARASQR